ncbi:MAG TPA: [protein-PII] uridylyltransferase [Nocardioides sp.]|nr:[protein-PII] uridylyltransferase [Nocardioides sp.]
MTAQGRRERTAAADERCVEAYAGADLPDTGAALVAVGGYGRSELAPYSDLDIVLVADDHVELGSGAEQVWYPLWDSGTKLDHSVRTFTGMLEAAAGDLRVALGLLDMRHLAGDPNLTLRLRTQVLTHWRRTAKDRLPELRQMVESRHQLMGELAHVSVPDIKEAEGGLRDAGVLKALVATWLVDVPHVDLERSRLALLDARDVLHEVAGRAGDRIGPDAWAELAPGLGLADAAAVQRHLRVLGRRIAHLSRLTWRRTDDVLLRPSSPAAVRRPRLEPLGPGVALSAGEVVLAADADPAAEPLLLLRAAALAAERDVELSPTSTARLVREGSVLPDPWPEGARQLFVRLLAAGPGLRAVWETLEETGAMDRILPEWERIRLLPHASVIHRFTVDRHVVETCIEASALIRHVGRPDVLMVAALLHDIGKGELTEHSVAGEPIARAIATRMGFDERSVDLIGTLVRWHLLLAETASARDPDDPATVRRVTERVPDLEALNLLRALTESDARATAPKAWSSWRANLIDTVGRQAAEALGGAQVESPAKPTWSEVAVPKSVRKGATCIDVELLEDGAQVTVIAPDRLGLLADVAALFATQRASVRQARAWSQGDVAVSVWDIADAHLDGAVLRQRFGAIAAGRLDPAERLRRTLGEGLAPTVAVRPEASSQSTVLEVRAADRTGVLYLVCAALAAQGLSVRSAHVDTLGPQAVDVFYVQEEGAGALGDLRASQAAHAVREALTPGA